MGTLLESGKRSGGVAVLLPPGWKAEKAHELVPSRALALLVRDRLTQFYIVSVYLHPDSKKRDLEKLIQEWTRLDKDTADWLDHLERQQTQSGLPMSTQIC